MIVMRLRVLIPLFCLGILATGCFSTLSPTKQINTSQAAINKQEKKIISTAEEINKNEETQKSQVSMLAAGTQYSLNQVTNPSVQVKTAQKLNERIVSIVGAPNLDDLQKIHQIVDYLNSEVDKEKSKGASLLASKDKEISNIQKESKELEEKYNLQVEDLKNKIKIIAKNSDDKEATLNQMSGFFGLNAVFWGLKRFVFSSLTGILIFGAIFLALRILSTVNPIAGAAFAIFNLFGSLILSIIKILTPQAFSMSHFVPADKANAFKEALTKMVDSIQDLKVQKKGVEKQPIDLEDVLNKFKEELDQKDKDLIVQILRDEKWKK
jgi:hypothetical protein